ncbi:MAG: pantothenate kinase [Spirochaetaceae bacterium]|jgi:type II pantothenate kinase|nr:pantothenate kinase [Spirochaetaceae bacterium]
MIIGIDIGSTTTKAVSIDSELVINKIKTKAMDAATSAAGALGKMLMEYTIKISQIEKIMITGAGSTKIKNDLFGIPTEKIDEITAIGVGGMFLAQRDNIIITNIGTGTAVIEAKKDGIAHIGGSGVGGGTILGLSKLLLQTSNFNGIMQLAESGNLNQVDLLLEDIMETDISFLRREATASNFGKMADTARHEDLALGILNLVYQVIGMLSVFAARSKGIDRVIVTGNGSANPIGKEILSFISDMYEIAFEYPADAEYTTAIGAGLSGIRPVIPQRQ